MSKNTFDAINAYSKSIREILDKNKYEIDVFQREYMWQRKQMEDLIDDLSSKFLSTYNPNHERKQVQSYPKYFLGPIILSKKKDGNISSIIDGQQRITSITLLLIYLNHLQKDRSDRVEISDLILSKKYGQDTYNLQIPDREECIDSLYKIGSYEKINKSESINNIIERYKDIEELFPEEIKSKALPYFLDWFIDNIVFVEIVTFSDEDAYLIFETMNDRGLNLTSTEMLKGFLLSQIDELEKKNKLNDLWIKRISDLKSISKEEDLEFFKAWFRAKYAETIRTGKKGAENEDFEKIARFHSWVKENLKELGLQSRDDYYRFVNVNFEFYSQWYLNINEASKTLLTNLENIRFLSLTRFAPSFYYPLLLAPIKMTDDKTVIQKKLNLVSLFIEAFIVRRLVNNRTISHASIRYTMYNLIKDIRDKDIIELASVLKNKLEKSENLEGFEGMSDYRLNQQNKRFIHYLIARLTNFIEIGSGMSSRLEDYIIKGTSKPYEIEHIWSNKYDEHRNEFSQKEEFEKFRNMIGALLLVPNGFNQSYSSDSYEKKLEHYYSQNLLAQSLSTKCYEKNPSFKKFIENTGLPFKPYVKFNKRDIEERQNLYQKICEQIWNPNRFDKIINS